MKDILVQSATLRLCLLHGTGEEHEGKIRGSEFPVPRSAFPVQGWKREDEEILTMKDLLVQSAQLNRRRFHRVNSAETSTPDETRCRLTAQGCVSLGKYCTGQVKSMKVREEGILVFLKLHVLHALHGEKVLCSLREAEEILTMKDMKSMKVREEVYNFYFS